MSDRTPPLPPCEKCGGQRKRSASYLTLITQHGGSTGTAASSAATGPRCPRRTGPPNAGHAVVHDRLKPATRDLRLRRVGTQRGVRYVVQIFPERDALRQPTD